MGKAVICPASFPGGAVTFGDGYQAMEAERTAMPAAI